ncbi:hypothetical protein SBDP1_1590036 [Syntrophobacter sp. SbD1]|nr:hypothetical protein SBDP1_1590036 [Syntrophobacter sp. SbD1]
MKLRSEITQESHDCITLVDIALLSEYILKVGAGWSSQVARRAHNPKVPGSNPGPAIKKNKGLRENLSPFFFSSFNCSPHMGLFLPSRDCFPTSFPTLCPSDRPPCS